MIASNGTTPGAKPSVAVAYKPGVKSADELYKSASKAKTSALHAAVAVDDEYLLDANGNARVIIELVDPPLTNYFASLSGAASRSFLSPTGAGNRLDANSASSLTYRAQLQKTQDSVINIIAAKTVTGKLNVTYRYDVAYNGFAAAVPLNQIDAIKALPDVKSVHPDTLKTIRMDASLPLIGAPSVWANISSTLGITQAGKGVKVAIVDTGIDPANPFFANTGVFTYPAGYPKGFCANTPGFCNGKIIAARYYTQSSSVNISETLTPLDADGHGTHTSGTAAGNHNVVAHVNSITATVSGVAPFAYLMTYKGLWLNVAGDNGSGETSGLIQGINDAVADGADVINNSWGGGARTGDPATLPENVAAVNAANVGVIVVWAAGNSGPSANTVDDLGGDPRLLSVAASTAGRSFVGAVTVGSTNGSVTVPPTATNLLGLSIGAGAQGAQYVDVGNIVGPLTPNSLTGKVCLVTRGTLARVQKSQYCADAGAVATVLRNNWQSAAAPDDLELDLHIIPTIQLHKAESAVLTDWLNSLGALSTTVLITVGPGLRNTTFDIADVVADFSSRGTASNIGLIKPDLIAPGVNILSSFHSVADPTRSWAFESGTSMASPHVAGSAALLLSAHPEWYSLNSYDRMLRVKSALMNTSVTSVTVSGGAPAMLEDMGAGRISLLAANDPGVIFDPPSSSFGQVAAGGATVFTVTNVTHPAVPITLTASIVKYGNPLSNTYALTATPAKLVVPAGGSMVYTLSLSTSGLPQGDYEGQVYWTQDNGPRVLHVPFWFRRVGAAFDAAVNVTTPRDQGGKTFSGLVGNAVLTTSATLYGLAAPLITQASAPGETEQNAASFPLVPAKGWYLQTYKIPANTGRLVVSTGNSSVSDVDLYLLYDFTGTGYHFADGNPANPNSDVFAASAGGTANERVDILGGPGSLLEYLGGETILIAVYNFTSAPASFKVRTWAATPTDGSVSLSGLPPALTDGQVITPLVTFNKAMTPGESYYGLVNLGDDANETALAQVLVNVDRTASEVVKTVNPAVVATGTVVTYSIAIQNQEALAHSYAVTDELPAGVTYAPGSLTGPNARYDVGLNAIIITSNMPALVKSPNYAIADSISSPSIVNDSPLGGFYSLTNFGAPAARADNSTFFSDIACPFSLYDSTNAYTTTFSYNTNGLFGPRSGLSPNSTGTPYPIPSLAGTHGFIAGAWNDMSITNTNGMTGTGRQLFRLYFNALTCPTDFVTTMQFTRLHRKNDTGSFLDVQYLYDASVPDVHWVQYGNVSGTFGTTAGDVIGAENFDGSLGVAYTGPIVNDLVLKYYRPMVPPPPITVTFQVTVNATGPAIITNTLDYTVDAPHTGEISVNAPQLRVPGPPVSVVVTPNTLPADGVSIAAVTATLLDSQGLPLPGVFVNLVSTAGIISPAYGTSDSNGLVTATLTAPTTAGTGTVSALAGIKTATAPVTFTQSATTYNLLSGSVLTETPTVTRKNGIITYTFTVSNTGNGDASNVLIVGSIPSGTTYLSGSANGGSPTGGLLASVVARQFAAPDGPAATTAIAWSGNIPAHSSHTIKYSVKVDILEGIINNTSHVYVSNTEVGVGDFTVSARIIAYKAFLVLIRR